MKSQLTTLHGPKQSDGGSREKGWERVLLYFLREKSEKPEVKRVERVLSRMVAAQASLDEVHRFVRASEKAEDATEFLASQRRASAFKRAYATALEELRSSLKSYRWCSSISGDLHGFHEELESARNPVAAHSAWECVIVRLLLDETKKVGVISRFRKCSECSDWFYASTSHQQFCAVACRRRHASHNPDFKEKRRVYMREQYRPLQRDLERLALQRAKNQPRSKGAK